MANRPQLLNRHPSILYVEHSVLTHGINASDKKSRAERALVKAQVPSMRLSLVGNECYGLLENFLTQYESANMLTFAFPGLYRMVLRSREIHETILMVRHDRAVATIQIQVYQNFTESRFDVCNPLRRPLPELVLRGPRGGYGQPVALEKHLHRIPMRRR